MGLRALAGFAKALKIKYEDIEVGLDFEPEAGLADNEDLEGDLSSLLEQVGSAARSAGTAVVLFIDELQVHRARSVCGAYPRFTSLRAGTIAGDSSRGRSSQAAGSRWKR